MATQADYLVTQSANDAQALIVALAQVRTITNRMVQRARALGTLTWDAYTNWTAGYTAQEAKALITVLEALPDSIIDDAARNRLHRFVANIQ